MFELRVALHHPDDKKPMTVGIDFGTMWAPKLTITNKQPSVVLFTLLYVISEKKLNNYHSFTLKVSFKLFLISHVIFTVKFTIFITEFSSVTFIRDYFESNPLII